MTKRSAQAQVIDELQRQLRDLLCLAVVGDHVRWVVTGDETAELAEWLGEASTQWRAWAHQVANYLVKLGVAPDGRVRSLAKDIPGNWVSPGWLSHDEARRLPASRLGAVCEWARYRRSQAASRDTGRLLDAVCSGLEEQAESLPVAGAS